MFFLLRKNEHGALLDKIPIFKLKFTKKKIFISIIS